MFTFAVPNTWTDGAYTWSAPGQRSAAHVLMDGASSDAAASARTAYAFGRHLKIFHTSAVTADSAYAAPRFPTRLATWIHTASGPRAAPAFHTILRHGLGTRRWSKLTDYTCEATTGSGDLAHVIGWATLGSLIITDAPEAAPHAVMLCGPEGTLAASEIDLGCALGELHEITESLTTRAMATEPVTAWRDALLKGYGTPGDVAKTARAAVVRVAAHAHDFAAYVGFHTELNTYVGMIADLLDNEGTQTMPEETR
uniref:Uncharacterized protein n=1 Tax=Streptomyces sp. NBC_00008 TaxID=2903610 RepID=A0AAU2VR17_9ACTN